MVYRLAAGTGFRASELRSLTPERFDLDGNPPTVTVLAANSKRRHGDIQPIRLDLATLFAPWLAQKPEGGPVFDLPEKTARMIRADLAAARAAWLDEASTAVERQERQRSDFLRYADHAGRVADFHALRHTYISDIVGSGASVKVAQELARHSTPTLTIGRYAHTRLHDLSTALDSLPANPPTDEPETLRATGTDGVDPQQYPQQRARETVRHDASWRGGGADERSSDNAPNRLASATLCDEVPHGATLDKNAPDRIRTCDLRFRRPDQGGPQVTNQRSVDRSCGSVERS